MDLYKISLLVLLFAFFSACNQEGASNEDTEEPAEEFTEERVEEFDWVEKDDAEFLVEVYSFNIMINRYSTLAVQKASTPALRDFATKSALFHENLNNEIENMAASKVIVLPETVGEDVQDYLAELEEKEGPAFDEAYLDVLHSIQDKVINNYEEAAREGNDGSLRAWASGTLPNLKAHAVTVEELKERLN